MLDRRVERSLSYVRTITPRERALEFAGKWNVWGRMLKCLLAVTFASCAVAFQAGPSVSVDSGGHVALHASVGALPGITGISGTDNWTMWLIPYRFAMGYDLNDRALTIGGYIGLFGFGRINKSNGHDDRGTVGATVRWTSGRGMTVGPGFELSRLWVQSSTTSAGQCKGDDSGSYHSLGLSVSGDVGFSRDHGSRTTTATTTLEVGGRYDFAMYGTKKPFSGCTGIDVPGQGLP